MGWSIMQEQDLISINESYDFLSIIAVSWYKTKQPLAGGNLYSDVIKKLKLACP